MCGQTSLSDHNKEIRSSYEKYQDYQKTNIDWLGRIPNHWSLNIIEQLADVKAGYQFDSDNFDQSSGFPLIRIRNIRGESINLYYNGDISPEMQQVIVEKGDIIVGMDGDFRVYWWKEEDALLNQRMSRITSNDYLIRRYIYYILPIALNYIQKVTASTTVKHLSTNKIRKLKIPKVPRDEIESIVRFLDDKIKQINELIQEKENLVDLLEEEKSAIITQTTTSGLNNERIPTHESKSGTINQLPSDWERSKLGNITTKLTNGYVGSTKDILKDDGVPYIQSTHIENGEIEFDGEFFVSEEWSKDHRTSRLKEGDVLLVQTGDVGESAVVREDLDGANCHALIIARPVEEVNSLYLNLFLESRLGKNLLERTQTGATLKHLNTTRVKDVTIPVPPKEEQKEIVEYLESKQEEFDSTVDLINQGIERLKEYRTALITEAVTGQIDVRGEV